MGGLKLGRGALYLKDQQRIDHDKNVAVLTEGEEGRRKERGINGRAHQ